MKTFSPTVSALLAQDHVEAYLLIAILERETYLTTAPFDLTMSDDNVYLASNTLESIDPPRISSIVDRESFKIVLGDPQMVLRSYFESGALGDTVVIRMCFRSGDDILTDLADTLIIYRGKIDNHSFNANLAEGRITVTIESSSPLASLDRRNAFYTSKESMRSRYPDDSAFDEVFVASGRALVKWGRA